MIYTICVIALLIIAALILFLPKTQEVDYAFAGSPCGTVNKEIINLSRYRTISKVGNERVDISHLKRFIVKGYSLEKVGVPNGSDLYALSCQKDNIDVTNMASLNRIVGHFIILKIDIERTLAEHPEKELTIKEGYKARLAVNVFPARLNRQEFNNLMSKLLEKDALCHNKETMLEISWNKYAFASQYYNKSAYLIVSITFHEGEEEGYSFHSPYTLYGVVKYKNKIIS